MYTSLEEHDQNVLAFDFIQTTRRREVKWTENLIIRREKTQPISYFISKLVTRFNDSIWNWDADSPVVFLSDDTPVCHVAQLIQVFQSTVLRFLKPPMKCSGNGDEWQHWVTLNKAHEKLRLITTRFVACSFATEHEPQKLPRRPARHEIRQPTDFTRMLRRACCHASPATRRAHPHHSPLPVSLARTQTSLALSLSRVPVSARASSIQLVSESLEFYQTQKLDLNWISNNYLVPWSFTNIEFFTSGCIGWEYFKVRYLGNKTAYTFP